MVPLILGNPHINLGHMTLKECVDIEERKPCLTLTAHEAYFKERDDDADTTEYTEAWPRTSEWRFVWGHDHQI